MPANLQSCQERLDPTQFTELSAANVRLMAGSKLSSQPAKRSKAEGPPGLERRWSLNR